MQVPGVHDAVPPTPQVRKCPGSSVIKVNVKSLGKVKGRGNSVRQENMNITGKSRFQVIS